MYTMAARQSTLSANTSQSAESSKTPEPSGVNRRRYERHEISVRLLMRRRLNATSGYTVNLSRGGALMRTAGPLTIGDLYECTLELPDAVLRRSARVLRELPGYIYAVEFETLIPEPTKYAK
jgi:hypothetical protein